MTTDPEPPAVTVVIPTLDGERHLDDVLHAIESQDIEGRVEILVIDSGSTDGTLGILRRHPAVTVHGITRAEFGHGRTRNLGARLASGTIVAFLTQDAVPAHPGWLRELILPLRDEAVAGVFGRQIPRPGCFPLLKYEIIDTFRSRGPDDATTEVALAPGATPEELDSAGFYSDVNAASRRSFLTDVIPYRDVPYSEDFAFARDALTSGRVIAYAGRGTVVHSNDLTLRGYRDRVAEETSSLIRTGVRVREHGLVARITRWGWGVLRDSRRILHDPDYSTPQRIGWLLRNPAFHAAKWQGYARGLRTRS